MTDKNKLYNNGRELAQKLKEQGQQPGNFQSHLWFKQMSLPFKELILEHPSMGKYIADILYDCAWHFFLFGEDSADNYERGHGRSDLNSEFKEWINDYNN